MPDILTPDLFVRRKPDTHLWQVYFRSSRAIVIMFTGTILECEAYMRLQQSGFIHDRTPETAESLGNGTSSASSKAQREPAVEIAESGRDGRI